MTKPKTKTGTAKDHASFSRENKHIAERKIEWLGKSNVAFDLAIRTGIPLVLYRLIGPPTTVKQVQPGLWYVLANKRVRYLKQKPTHKIVERIEKEHACIR